LTHLIFDLRKYIAVKRIIMTNTKTCTAVAKLNAVEGLTFAFTILRFVYPKIEPYLGPKVDCQDSFFVDTVLALTTLQASAAKGAKVEAADVCT
jgi:hypothetical protein